MPTLAPITLAMYPELRDGLLRQLNPTMPESYWKRTFGQLGSEDRLGYVLLDGSKIVGLLGMLFSERTIAGQTVPFCNLHTWIVQPEFRGSSLLLLKPLASMRDYTLTDMSATPSVESVLKHFGFSELDQSAIVLPRLPWQAQGNGVKLMDLGDPSVCLAEDRGSHLSSLSEAERAIHRDHCEVDCGQLLVRDAEGDCYVVYSRITHGRLPDSLASCLIHHISEPKRFAAHHAAIRAHVLRKSRSLWVVVDSRLLGGMSIPQSLRVPATKKLYRSANLLPKQIDSLYTELAYYKFSTLPTLKSLLTSAKNYFKSPPQRFSKPNPGSV